MKRAPVTRVQNLITDTCSGVKRDEVSAEFKKSVESRFKEEISPLREERIKRIQAQIQPISPIAPKQPIVDKTTPNENKQHEKKNDGNFHDMLKEKIEEATMLKEGTIVEENGKYCVKSHTGKNLGCSDTHEGAVKRLRQVEFFKHQK